jgi:hypothetical protein
MQGRLAELRVERERAHGLPLPRAVTYQSAP